jgi:hypothetical protein
LSQQRRRWGYHHQKNPSGRTQVPGVVPRQVPGVVPRHVRGVVPIIFWGMSVLSTKPLNASPPNTRHQTPKAVYRGGYTHLKHEHHENQEVLSFKLLLRTTINSGIQPRHLNSQEIPIQNLYILICIYILFYFFFRNLRDQNIV